MKIKLYLLSVVSLGLFCGFAHPASAELDLSGITYPIPELADCASQSECEVYCDLVENMHACIDFAEARGLITPEEANESRVFADLGVRTGPGGCDLVSDCELYCDNLDHIDECLDFAAEYNLLTEAELEEAQAVASALSFGISMPGNCYDQESCDNYCLELENLEECLVFAVEAGLTSQAEADAMRATGGVGPGGCRTTRECDAFCAEQRNWEECLDFARTYNIPVP